MLKAIRQSMVHQIKTIEKNVSFFLPIQYQIFPCVKNYLIQILWEEIVRNIVRVNIDGAAIYSFHFYFALLKF